MGLVADRPAADRTAALVVLARNGAQQVQAAAQVQAVDRTAALVVHRARRVATAVAVVLEDSVQVVRGRGVPDAKV